MAMIQCEECGEWISSRANACPHCGYPLIDSYDVGYEYEEGARQSRIDEANRQAQKQANAKAKWNIQSIIICIITFFVSFGMGYSLFPKALAEENAPFYPIVLFILAIAIIVLNLTVKFWKQLVFHMLFRHAFFINMLTLAFSSGYIFGCIAGM